MPRPTRTQRLQVLLNGRPVGRYEKLVSGARTFTYEDEWLAWEEGRLPVSISMPLRPEPYGAAYTEPVFENLLPDEVRVRRNVAERLGAEGIDAFSLLAAMGRDCVGALQFMPDGSEDAAVGPVEGEKLTEAEIAETIRNLHVENLGMDENKDFRLSIAGAQDKTALLKQGTDWYRPIGATATTHILKPKIGELREGDMSLSVENEYLCLKLCEALGASVARADIETFEDQTVLSVERFDRLWTSDGRLLRLPQEDFCQALSVPSTQKYQSNGGPGIQAILGRLIESDDPEADRLEFLRAQIIFWLLGATDGHAKNFSIAHQPGGGFALTPLYDVISAQPLVDAKTLSENRFKLAMSVGDNNRYIMKRIHRRHFQQSADSAGLPRGSVERIIADVLEHVPGAIDCGRELTDGKLPDSLVESVLEGLQARVEMIRG